jgi:hypothetical protein
VFLWPPEDARADYHRRGFFVWKKFILHRPRRRGRVFPMLESFLYVCMNLWHVALGAIVIVPTLIVVLCSRRQEGESWGRHLFGKALVLAFMSPFVGGLIVVALSAFDRP